MNAWGKVLALLVGSVVLVVATPAQAQLGEAPDGQFLFGSDIFATGQSNNLGPAANQVLREGMYWFSGDCPGAGGSSADCDLLRFGATFYPAECSHQRPARVNHYIPAQEDGGGVVRSQLSSIQSVAPYCDSDRSWRPLDTALAHHQHQTFSGTHAASDSPWDRPNLNLLVIADLPQTTDRADISDYEADSRAKGAIGATCDMLYGDDGTTSGAWPAMPTWVMMARVHGTDAATYGGLLAAAGGTGECCYDPDYDPRKRKARPCDPTDASQQIDICDMLSGPSGLTETDIRAGVARGHFQCAPGEGVVQTGSMDFGTRSRGTLPHILCHLAGHDGHSNCTGPQADRNKRRPTDVLGKMACVRKVPDDYDGGPLEICDRHDNCESLDICDESSPPGCSGAEFIDPNETLIALRGQTKDGTVLCDRLAGGGYLREPSPCAASGEACAVDGAHGRCQFGEVVCDSDGREVCEPLYEPMPEICNGLDDDCDGTIDNLSDSWDNFSYDPATLGDYDGDSVDRTGIHCYERDVCTCSSGPLEYGGPGFEEHVTSWAPGSCQCGEGLDEGGYTPAPTADHGPKKGCSAGSGVPMGPGWLALAILGLIGVRQRWL